MVWKSLKKTKTELPYDPATPLPGISPNKTIIWKDSCTSMFTASTALLKIARTWKQSKCPSKDEWKKKKRWMDKYVVHIQNGILLIHKKEQIMLFSATWMNLEMIILSEISQKEKDNIWYHLYVGSKIQQKWTHPRNRNRLTENSLVVAKEEKGRKGNRLGVLRLAEANYSL